MFLKSSIYFKFLLCLVSCLNWSFQILSHQVPDFPPPPPPPPTIGYGYRGFPGPSYHSKYPFNYFDQHRASPISSSASGDPYTETSGLWRYRDRYPPPRTYQTAISAGYPNSSPYPQPPPPQPSGPSYNMLQAPSSYYSFESKFAQPTGPANFADSTVAFDNRYGWYPRYPVQPLTSMNTMFNTPMSSYVSQPSNPAMAPPMISPYNFPSRRIARAVAEVRGSENNKITGSVSFEQEENDHVIIRGKIVGVPPGPHGLHILEKSITGHDCMSGGEHYNPQKTAHGGKHDWVRHVGDLGNIFSDRDGIAYFDLTDQIVSLTGGYSILNRTIVITEKPDDLGRSGDAESKKTGNSGLPIACGVIQLANFSQ